MWKTVVVGATALLLTASTLAYAQAPSTREAERLSEADIAHLTDARVSVVKAALRLTPDQDKLWPPVEDAIRARGKDRATRLAAIQKEVGELRGKSPLEVLRDRNPVDFLSQRADALTQRGADLKKLADAWRPLYQTLTTDQKRRLAHLAIVALREMRNPVERRRILEEEGEED